MTGKRYRHLLYEDEELQILPRKLTTGKRGSRATIQRSSQKRSQGKLQRKLGFKERIKRRMKRVKNRTILKKEVEDIVFSEAMPIQPHSDFPFTQPYTLDWTPQESHKMEEDIIPNEILRLPIRDDEELLMEMIVTPNIEKPLSVYGDNEPRSPMSVPLSSPLFPIEHEEQFLDDCSFYNKYTEPAIGCFYNN